jgi:hypothetical protein
MSNIKISQLTPKGANLDATDLLEISEFDGSGYVTRSITGQEIIDAAAGGGAVTNITVNAPLSTTGGTTPDLSIYEADASTDGFITAVDWNTFNGKQPTLVSGTNIKTINGSSVLGSGDLVVSGGGDSGFHGMIKPTSALFPNGLVTSFINTTSLPNIAQTANRITAYPFIPASTMTSTALVVRCAIGVASALGKIVIYSNVNGEPSTILYQSANLDCSVSGDKTATTAFTFTQGVVYWLAFHSSSTQTMSGIQASSMIPIFTNTTAIYNHYYRGFTFASGPPSPMSPDTYATGTVTNIGIKLT